MKAFSKFSLTMLKDFIYVCVFKDAGVRLDLSLKWPKVKGNLNLIIKGEYTMISLAYKVSADVIILPQVIVHSNITDSQYDIDNNESMLMETHMVTQVCNV